MTDDDLVYKVFYTLEHVNSGIREWMKASELQIPPLGPVKILKQGYHLNGENDEGNEHEFDLIFTVTQGLPAPRHFRLRCYTDSYGNVSELTSSRQPFCEVTPKPVNIVEYVPIGASIQPRR